MKKLSIFSIYKIKTEVMYSSQERRSETQLSHDKRDIPAFDTVLFHTNLSSLLRKYLSDILTEKKSIQFWAKHIKKAFLNTLQMVWKGRKKISLLHRERRR